MPTSLKNWLALCFAIFFKYLKHPLTISYFPLCTCAVYPTNPELTQFTASQIAGSVGRN